MKCLKKNRNNNQTHPESLQDRKLNSHSAEAADMRANETENHCQGFRHKRDKACYRFDISWIGNLPEDPWKDLQLVTFFNQTSLYEPLFVGGFPNHFLRCIARHGMMPAANKALRLPVMGYFFRMVASQVIPITRRRDHTWTRLYDHLKPDSMLIIMQK